MDDNEDLGFGPVCRDCAPKPLGLTSDQVNPATLIGKFVKVGVETGIPDSEGPTKEHIWVRVTGVNDQGELVGKIYCDPVAIDYRRDDDVALTIDEIEDIYQEGAS